MWPGLTQGLGRWSGSQGQAYCKKYNQEIEVTSGVVKLYFGGGVESGSQALCGEEDNSWQVVMVMQDASLVSISLPGNLMFVIEVGLASMQMVQKVGMGAYQDKYEAHKPAYSGTRFF